MLAATDDPSTIPHMPAGRNLDIRSSPRTIQAAGSMELATGSEGAPIQPASSQALQQHIQGQAGASTDPLAAAHSIHHLGQLTTLPDDAMEAAIGHLLFHSTGWDADHGPGIMLDALTLNQSWDEAVLAHLLQLTREHEQQQLEHQQQSQQQQQAQDAQRVVPDEIIIDDLVPVPGLLDSLVAALEQEQPWDPQQWVQQQCQAASRYERAELLEAVKQVGGAQGVCHAPCFWWCINAGLAHCFDWFGQGGHKHLMQVHLMQVHLMQVHTMQCELLLITTAV
jgi:hypothetical protein